MTTAAEVARGVSRLLIQEGYSPILEITLAIPDLKGDMKWPEYLEFCELFYFAIPPDFPDELVPSNTGLIVADRYGGAIVRPSPAWQIHPSRRKAVTLRFAKVAADRLSNALELAAAPMRVLGEIT